VKPPNTLLLVALVACGSVREQRSPTTESPIPVGESLVPVAPACRGAALELAPPFDACACHEVRNATYQGRAVVIAGEFCGQRHPDEVDALPIDVVDAPKVVVAGEDFTIVVRVTNPNPTPVTLRIPRTDMSAKLALPNGEPLPMEALASGGRREALVELAGGGTLRISMKVAGHYSKWEGSGPDAKIGSAAAPPGDYAVRVFAFGFAGLDEKLVPVRVRAATSP
jgi:hypothetical protein